VYGTKLKKNLLMERFIQRQIKDRTDECFDDHFPCRKSDYDRHHVWNWLKLFILYLHAGMDRKRFTTVLIRNGGQVNRALLFSQYFQRRCRADSADPLITVDFGKLGNSLTCTFAASSYDCHSSASIPCHLLDSCQKSIIKPKNLLFRECWIFIVCLCNASIKVA
jgi:hypothetical protein